MNGMAKSRSNVRRSSSTGRTGSFRLYFGAALMISGLVTLLLTFFNIF